MKINKSIFKKDSLDLCKNLETLYTILGVPLVIIVFFLLFLKQNADIFMSYNRQISALHFDQILNGLELSEYVESTTSYLLQWNTTYFYIIALLVFALPITLSSTAFTSEKEQGTIELLFHAPISDADLLLTKMAVCTLPSIFLGVFCYGFILMASYLHSGSQAFNYMMQPKWLLLHFLLVPLYSIISAGIGLSISIVKKSSRAALMLSILLILPLLMTIVPIILGNVLFTLNAAVIGLIAAIFLLSAVFYIALKLFNREKILLSYY